MQRRLARWLLRANAEWPSAWIRWASRNSPAVGAGQLINCPAADQRGFARPSSPCAVGAFEPGDAASPACGEASEVSGNLRADADGGHSWLITASDALIVLRAATGSAECPLCVCDVNDSGGTTASDALVVLRFAVGQSVTIDCPPCT